MHGNEIYDIDKNFWGDTEKTAQSGSLSYDAGYLKSLTSFHTFLHRLNFYHRQALALLK